MNQERYWYQDGGTVFLIFLMGGVALLVGYSFYLKELDNAKPLIDPEIAGRLHQPMFGSPRLEITVWHQHPGVIRNGKLLVNLNEDPAKGQETWDRRVHSFEVWEPNKDHAVTFEFPLTRYDPQQPIHVGVILLGSEIKMSVRGVEWLGTTWKSNLEAQQPAGTSSP